MVKTKFIGPTLILVIGLVSFIAYQLIPVCNPDVQTAAYCNSTDRLGNFLFVVTTVAFALEIVIGVWQIVKKGASNG